MSYHVDNAVIMAAGTSSRFAPLSYEKPKALIEVKGEILIERQLRQLQEAGICQVLLVVGYQKEQFAYLKKKFDVILIKNNDYLFRNNHASIYAVKNYLKIPISVPQTTTLQKIHLKEKFQTLIMRPFMQTERQTNGVWKKIRTETSAKLQSAEKMHGICWDMHSGMRNSAENLLKSWKKYTDCRRLPAFCGKVFMHRIWMN